MRRASGDHTIAPGVGLEPTSLGVNSALLYQLSYPGMASTDDTASTSPITAEHQRRVVTHPRTTHDVLRSADGRISWGAVRLAELSPRNARQRRPELDGGVEVQSFVQIQIDSPFRLVNVEEVA
jgi:hypothetical protein